MSNSNMVYLPFSMNQAKAQKPTVQLIFSNHGKNYRPY